MKKVIDPIILMVRKMFPQAERHQHDPLHYRDTTYTRTKRKVRYKFFCMTTGVGRNEHCTDGKTAKRIVAALKRKKIPFHSVLAFNDEILIYQNFPIKVIELSPA